MSLHTQTPPSPPLHRVQISPPTPSTTTTPPQLPPVKLTAKAKAKAKARMSGRRTFPQTATPLNPPAPELATVSARPTYPPTTTPFYPPAPELASTSTRPTFPQTATPLYPPAPGLATMPPRPTFLQTATPLYPPPPPLELKVEELTSYYSLDRAVFSRLVAIHRREPKEAFHIMAFWVWLQKNARTKEDRTELMMRIAELVDPVLSALADETVTCLHCIENNFFPFDPNHDVLPLMQGIAGSDMRLQFFHRNRVWVREGIAKAIHDDCNRAFEDILRQCYRPGGLSLIRNSINFGPGHRHGGGESFRHGGGEGSSSRGGRQEEEEREVAPEDRTMFLTFSKGYPIAKEELEEYFTTRFGDVYEGITMEDSGIEQPLYAKMVMRKASLIPKVLSWEPRFKFHINGKHVWARKFIVKKNDRRRNQ